MAAIAGAFPRPIPTDDGILSWKRIEAEKPDVVGTTAFTAGIVDALKVLKLAKEIDPRITTVGRVLRKTKIDELPELWNVVRGEMSLVGPRPPVPYEFEIYKDWHKKRLSVRPGITGLWQVAGRSEVAFEDMVLLDLFYAYNRSIAMDMNILYETVFAVLAKKGAH